MDWFWFPHRSGLWLLHHKRPWECHSAGWLTGPLQLHGVCRVESPHLALQGQPCAHCPQLPGLCGNHRTLHLPELHPWGWVYLGADHPRHPAEWLWQDWVQHPATQWEQLCLSLRARCVWPPAKSCSVVLHLRESSEELLKLSLGRSTCSHLPSFASCLPPYPNFTVWAGFRVTCRVPVTKVITAPVFSHSMSYSLSACSQESKISPPDTTHLPRWGLVQWWHLITYL